MDNQTQYGQQAYVPHHPQFAAQVEEPISLKEWLITLLILLIPLVNFVMLFVWAFGEGKESKKNFFKAYLIFVAIGIGLNILLMILFGAALFSIISSLV